jgi:hypothetical protein
MKTIPARNRGKAQEAAKALVHGCSGRCAPFLEECDLRDLFWGVFVRMEKCFPIYGTDTELRMYFQNMTEKYRQH